MEDMCLDDPELNTVLMAFTLKCSDIGHSAKSEELHTKWTYLVCDEFFI